MYYVTTKEMAKLDKLAVKNGLEIRQMMELAGWHMLSLVRQLRTSNKAKITIVCGKGNKGGDGLSAARHLVNFGYKVSVILMAKNISKDSNHQLKMLKKMKVPITVYPSSKSLAKKEILNSKIIIDALIGYNLKGAPQGIFAETVKLINQAKGNVFAFDLPTGLEPNTGQCYEPCVQTDITLCLSTPKKCFKYKDAQKISGKILIADIGMPKFLYDQIKRNSRPKFEQSNNTFVLVP